MFREFVDAIRAEGMEVGVYLSPADLFQMNDGGFYGDGSEAVDSVIPTDPASLKTNPTKGREIEAGKPGAGQVEAEKSEERRGQPAIARVGVRPWPGHRASSASPTFEWGKP